MEDRFLAPMDLPHPIQSGHQLRSLGDIFSLNVQGLDINIWRSGYGPKILFFLHGNSTAKEVFYEQFNRFCDPEWSLFAMDLPGHGASQNANRPDMQYTIPGYAHLIREVLQELSVEHPLFVGWSLGGNITLELIGQGQEMAGAMIFGAPPVGPGPDNFDKAYLPAPAGAVAGLAKPSREALSVFVREIYAGLRPIPDFMFEAARRTDGRARENMVAHWISSMAGYDQVETVTKSEYPICVVHGQAETLVSLPYLQSINWRNLWDGQIHIIEQAGHAPFVENPLEFNRILDEFAHKVFSGSADPSHGK